MEEKKKVDKVILMEMYLFLPYIMCTNQVNRYALSKILKHTGLLTTMRALVSFGSHSCVLTVNSENENKKYCSCMVHCFLSESHDSLLSLMFSSVMQC